MRPDIPLSRIVRPSILIWLTALFSVLTILDGNFFGLNVKDGWISLLGDVTMVAYGSYFVAKSYEHGKRILNEKDNNDPD